MLRKLIWVMAAVCLILSGGCISRNNLSVTPALQVAAPAAPVTLNPLFLRDAVSAEAAALLHPQLLGTNPETLEVEPRLVAAWEVKDNNRTYILTLRDDLYWSDGTPLTSADVAFTLRTICHRDYTGWMYPLLQYIEGANEYRADGSSDYADGTIAGISVPDEQTVEIRLKQAHAPFLTYLSFAPLPSRHLQGVAVAKLEGHPYGRTVPVGAGPYVLEEWRPDEYLHVKANSTYYLGEPIIKEIYYRFIPSPEAQLIELVAGKLDLIPTAVKVEDIPLLTGEQDIRIYSNSRLVYDYIGMNFSNVNSPLADARVRRALSLLIEKDELVENLLLGYGEPLHGPLLPLHFAYDKGFTGSAASLPAARELLLAAGYPQMHLKIIFNAGNAVRENVALLFSEKAAQVGVKIQVQVLEWEAFLAALNEGNFDLVVLGRGADADPDFSYHWHSQGAGNLLGYANDRVDSLLTEAAATAKQEKRTELYRQAQEIITKDAPIIWLYTRQAVHAATKKLENFSVHPDSLFYNVHLWTLSGSGAVR